MKNIIILFLFVAMFASFFALGQSIMYVLAFADEREVVMNFDNEPKDLEVLNGQN